MSRKLLVASSVLPTKSGGGELVLRRHLMGLDPARWVVDLVTVGESSEHPMEWPCHRVSRFPLPERLRSTRLGPWLNDQVFSGRLVSRSSLSRLVDKLRPDVILTVAHGELAPLAVWMSHARGIPLVTLFHDWWPDMVSCTYQGRPRIADHFAELGRVSDAALCVCQGMALELGAECRTEVLYPIPALRGIPRSRPALGRSDCGPLRFAYSGSLAGVYGKMVADLAAVLFCESQVDFRFCGPSNGDPRWAAAPCYEGMLPGDEFMTFIGSQDLLLVTMSFEGCDQRRARTSFPSKLVEYCQTGLPILIWGPESCSAVRWARQSNAAEVVTDAYPQAVAEALKRLHSNRGRLDELGRRSAYSAEKEFHPSQIQKQFEASLTAVVSS